MDLEIGKKYNLVVGSSGSGIYAGLSVGEVVYAGKSMIPPGDVFIRWAIDDERILIDEIVAGRVFEEDNQLFADWVRRDLRNRSERKSFVDLLNKAQS